MLGVPAPGPLSLLTLTLGLTSAVPEPSLAESLEALTQTCDQSANYVGILNAVHSSLDLQVTKKLIFTPSIISHLSDHRSGWRTWSSKSLTWSTLCPTLCRRGARHGGTPLPASRTVSTSVWSEARCVLIKCCQKKTLALSP